MNDVFALILRRLQCLDDAGFENTTTFTTEAAAAAAAAAAAQEEEEEEEEDLQVKRSRYYMKQTT